LQMLMDWAQQDPVSEKEINRNNAVYGIQKNRNPFIDYPGLEQYVWGSMKNEVFSYTNYLDPTGITVTWAETTPAANNGVYTLSGQRVNDSQLRPGIYIRGGKKVLIK